MPKFSAQFATDLATIAAHAVGNIPPGSELLLTGEAPADAAVAFAWWSVGEEGDGTDLDADRYATGCDAGFHAHFRTWEQYRRSYR